MNTPSRHLELVAPAAPGPAAWSDSELVLGLQRRDPRAAEALYDRLLPVVDRTLRRVLHQRSLDHDDLVQIVFEHIVRSILQRAFAQSCSLASWATLISSRVAINALRSRIRERRVLDRSADAPALDEVTDQRPLEKRLEARSDVAQLQRALTQLNEARREAVMLHDVLGHSLLEIAALTDVSVRAAQSRLFRGRKELLELLEAGDGSEASA
jgi:RNA polymerase sigma-70 factor (ECF subfamily)